MIDSFVRRRNIARYEGLLRGEPDPDVRATLRALLQQWRDEELSLCPTTRRAADDTPDAPAQS